MSETSSSVTDIVTRFGQYATEILTFVNSTEVAFYTFRNFPAFLAHVVDTELHADTINTMERAAQLVSRTASSQDQVLNCHLAMGLWSAFDAAIEDLVVEVVAREPQLVKEDRISKMRIGMTHALTADRHALAKTLVDEYKRTASGVGRADSLLDLVGVYTVTPQLPRRRILELAELRNVIAHRGSVVDQKAAEACPWLHLRVGERVSISSTRLDCYGKYLYAYSGETLMSCITKLGGEPHRAPRYFWTSAIKAEKIARIRGRFDTRLLPLVDIPKLISEEIQDHPLTSEQ